MFKDKLLKDFLADTASKKPTPGGGSISATNGALAYALTEMVANLTIGKEKYAEYEDELLVIKDKANKLYNELLDDIDRDASSFDQVMKAFKLPKETDDEKKHRSSKIQEGYKYAASVPLSIAEKIASSIDMIEYVIKNGNLNCVTDGLVALQNARSGIIGALLNVRINLGSIKDKNFVDEYVEKVNSLEKASISKIDVLYSSVNI